MALPSDQQTKLALRARHDSQALAELIADVDKPIWGAIRNRMTNRSEEDQEDVYQEIMFHLCRSIGKFTGKSSFFSWFHRIISNKISDYYRRSYKSNVFLMIEDTDIEDEPSYDPEWYPIQDALPPIYPKSYFDILYDREINGYSLSELAEKNNETYAGTRSTYRRAQAYFRQRIQR